MHAVIEAGATGVMFSETFAGGTVRMVREATKHLPRPPAIYGHNAGIGVKTRGDLAGSDRPAGPARRHRLPPDRPACGPGTPLPPPLRRGMAGLRGNPFPPLPGIRPTMIARAGGLDQGNIILNLADAERRGLSANILSWPARRSTRSRMPAAGPTRGWARKPCSRPSTCIAPASWPACRSTTTSPRCWRSPAAKWPPC